MTAAADSLVLLCIATGQFEQRSRIFEIFINLFLTYLVKIVKYQPNRFLLLEYLQGQTFAPKITFRNHIKLLTMNVNSIHSHSKDIQAQMAIHESNSDIVFLTETKLGEYSNTFNVSGYQIATQQNRKQGAGGVIILHKTAVKVHDSELESILEETQVAKCRYKDLTIIGVYRSPSVLEKDKNKVRKTKEQHACTVNF